MKTFTLLKSGIMLIVLGLLISLPMITSAQTIIDIQVSPSTLNLQNNGQVVTVHTDIAYSTVDTETVFMNGIEISSWKADNQGNFVAKFLMEEIVGLPLDIGDYNTLTLEGITVEGESFTGSDEVMVIDVSGKGKK
jgi:hypothetical protein